MSRVYEWAPLLPADLGDVNEIADVIHPTLPERPEVIAEKVALYPVGCRKLLCGAEIVGYGISHPWVLFSVPPLDSFLGNIPSTPDCLYLHDVAIKQEHRGNRSAEAFAAYVRRLAGRVGVGAVALVSVYGTHHMWNRFGFEAIADQRLRPNLFKYGANATYMVCWLPC